MNSEEIAAVREGHHSVVTFDQLLLDLERHDGYASVDAAYDVDDDPRFLVYEHEDDGVYIACDSRKDYAGLVGDAAEVRHFIHAHRDTTADDYEAGPVAEAAYRLESGEVHEYIDQLNELDAFDYAFEMAEERIAFTNSSGDVAIRIDDREFEEPHILVEAEDTAHPAVELPRTLREPLVLTRYSLVADEDGAWMKADRMDPEDVEERFWADVSIQEGNTHELRR